MKDQIVLTRKQTSHVVAGIIVCSFLLFMVGYFLGKRTALHEISGTTHTQFGNQIHYALQSLAQNESRLPQQRLVEAEKPLLVEESNLATRTESNKKVQQNSGLFYQARLISFGTISSAQQFANRLQRNGINTTIIKQEGTIPEQKGSKKSIQWYDVLTEKFSHEEHAQKVVEAVRHIVKLNDVRMIKVHDDGITRENDQKQIL